MLGISSIIRYTSLNSVLAAYQRENVNERDRNKRKSRVSDHDGDRHQGSSRAGVYPSG
jgi:hypothetical protein